MKSGANGAVVIVDLDGIVADLLTPWLEAYNDLYDDSLEIHHVLSWDIHKYVKPECGKKIYGLIGEPNFYNRVPALDGAVEGVNQLIADGHEIFMCSAVAVAPGQTPGKYQWVERNFPNFDPHRLVMCSHKYLLHGDVIIDDASHNILDYKKHHPEAQAVAIKYPYNQEIYPVVDCLAYDCYRPRQAWEQIVEFFRESRPRT